MQYHTPIERKVNYVKLLNTEQGFLNTINFSGLGEYNTLKI